MAVLAGLATAGLAHASAFVRVDQVGYTPDGPKRAYLLGEGTTFAVHDAGGGTVLDGMVGPSTGRWSNAFAHVRLIDFDTLRTPGIYTITVPGAQPSPPFRIGTARELWAPMIADARLFFGAQRDGADVIGSILNRRPAHLNDRHATAYAPPSYDENDTLTSDLDKVGGPVDAEGGWFDAGDFLKFVQTQSYTVEMLLLAVRDHPALMGPGAPGDLSGEARFGLRWLSKMWDDRHRTLYYQVGIGDGDGCEKICGDHDLWRLPEKDDNWPGAAKYKYIRHRPVLRAGPPHAKVSPNLAGRLAADFATCSEVYRSSDPAFADDCLSAARHVFALADTHPKGELLSASPHDFYPEESWQDDLELGATELAHALIAAGRPHAARPYVERALHWARAYMHSDFDGQDTLNLYDVSALAHAELARLAPQRAGALLADIRRQLDGAVRQAGTDPFQSGFAWNQYDVTSHLFGLVSEASLYDELAQSTRYRAFARHQLAAALGANAWGVSLVIGSGTTFPHCPQHVVANLNGALDGTAPILRGALVNGPNDVSQFDTSADQTPDGARACPPDHADIFAPFTSAGGARFLDNVGAWMAVEPAIDFTAGMPYALGRLMEQGA